MREGPAFGYWRDPVFLGASALYALNRFLLIPAAGAAHPVLRNHAGDFFLIPCALPALLFLQRVTGLRTHDRPPTPGECFLYLALWSFLFEFLFPHLLHRGVGDPRDVASYALGALVAMTFWHLPRTTPTLA